jgi:ABC-type uncharacterized transport system YnjBCD permease subunit
MMRRVKSKQQKGKIDVFLKEKNAIDLTFGITMLYVIPLLSIFGVVSNLFKCGKIERV